MSLLHGIKWRLLKKMYSPISKLNYYRVLKADLDKVKYKKNNDVIISLTSFPARLDTLDICLKSLLCQSVRPYKIIVYFGCDVKRDAVPKNVLLYEKRGVEFCYDDEMNLKPHKKYFYAMQEYNDKSVITVDDDVVYPRRMLERLISAHEKYPNTVCAGRVHRIMFDADGKFMKYNDWMHGDDLTKDPSFRLVPIGIGGVLYPAGAISEKAFDAKKIKELCLNADDLWLKCASCSNGVKVKFVEGASRFLYTIEEAQSVALRDTNVSENKNDYFWKNALNYFGLNEKNFN